MSARIVLSPRPNSFKFNEKVLDLSVPAKIGRANKEDRSSTDNGYFDCKVLSKPHALVLHEMSDFYLLDTGSSNGTFVNNIRLSKAGVESEPTQIYTGDIIRFGSDVLDKSRQVTQRCVIIKLTLINHDGTEYATRPSSSRLYRPTDNLEDIQTVTKNLQDSLSRERVLEDRLGQIIGIVKAIKDKSEGKDDINRLDVVEQEISKLFASSAPCNPTSEDRKRIENLRNEKAILRKEKLDLEEIIHEKEIYCENLQKKAVEDSRNINSLGAIILKLRQDITNLETVVATVKQTQEKVKAEYETRIFEERKAYEEELQRLWKKDIENEAEKSKLEEKLLCLMQYETDSSMSSAASTPTTIRQLKDSANLTSSSGLSTPTSLFITQDNHLNTTGHLEDYHEYLPEDNVGYDKLLEKSELLDSVTFELEVTKQELEMVKDENKTIREEVNQNIQLAKKNVDVFEELDKSRSEVQYLLSKIAEKDEQLESIKSNNKVLKSQAMNNWMSRAESDFESVFQENCLENKINAADKTGIQNSQQTTDVAADKPKSQASIRQPLQFLVWLSDKRQQNKLIGLSFLVIVVAYVVSTVVF